MKKSILCLVFAISGCASSAYESGWNSKTTSDAFHECAQTSVTPGFYFPENADRLVTMNLLSKEEAEKAKRHQVSVGDRECVAYAAYGFHPAKYDFTSNKEKQLLSRKVTYACDKSPIECPGKIITIADGRVIGVEVLKQ